MWHKALGHFLSYVICRTRHALFLQSLSYLFHRKCYKKEVLHHEVSSPVCPVRVQPTATTALPPCGTLGKSHPNKHHLQRGGRQGLAGPDEPRTALQARILQIFPLHNPEPASSMIFSPPPCSMLPPSSSVCSSLLPLFWRWKEVNREEDFLSQDFSTQDSVE